VYSEDLASLPWSILLIAQPGQALGTPAILSQTSPLALSQTNCVPGSEEGATRSWAGVTYNTFYGRNEVWKIAGTVEKPAFYSFLLS
jgi:hypothetical protein